MCKRRTLRTRVPSKDAIATGQMWDEPDARDTLARAKRERRARSRLAPRLLGAPARRSAHGTTLELRNAADGLRRGQARRLAARARGGRRSRARGTGHSREAARRDARQARLRLRPAGLRPRARRRDAAF